MVKHLAPLLLLAASIAWAVQLAFGTSDMNETSAVVAGSSLLVLAAVVTVGWLAAGARWVRFGALMVIAGLVTIAAYGSRSVSWWVALLLTVAAGVSILVTPQPAPGDDRQRPPRRATGVAVGLLAMPALIALTEPAGLGPAEWVFATLSLLLAWRYTQADTWALWAVRIIWPVAGAITVWQAGSAAGGIVRFTAIVVLATVAWHGDVALALERPRPVESVRMPPELLPEDILAAAGLDDRGRPLKAKNDTRDDAEKGQSAP